MFQVKLLSLILMRKLNMWFCRTRCEPRRDNEGTPLRHHQEKDCFKLLYSNLPHWKHPIEPSSRGYFLVQYQWVTQLWPISPQQQEPLDFLRTVPIPIKTGYPPQTYSLQQPRDGTSLVSLTERSGTSPGLENGSCDGQRFDDRDQWCREEGAIEPRTLWSMETKSVPLP